MLVKIDIREQKLYKKCMLLINSSPKFNDIILEYETLPLGDIIINDGNCDRLIIERKTINDLAASIKDGRYEEQSYRLQGLEHHNHDIIYLIEGDINQFNTSTNNRIDKQTIYSSMFSINYFKGFSLMRSFTLEESATIICNMAYKIGKDKNRLGFYTKDMKNLDNVCDTVGDIVGDVVGDVVVDGVGCILDDKLNDTVGDNVGVANNLMLEKEYCRVIKKVKKDNITTANIGEIMLCQIPGVSSSSAIAILSKFNTLPNLIKCIHEDELCLKNITTTDVSGQTRKISKTAIATIVKFLQ